MTLNLWVTRLQTAWTFFGKKLDVHHHALNSHRDGWKPFFACPSAMLSRFSPLIRNWKWLSKRYQNTFWNRLKAMNNDRIRSSNSILTPNTPCVHIWDLWMTFCRLHFDTRDEITDSSHTYLSPWWSIQRRNILHPKGKRKNIYITPVAESVLYGSAIYHESVDKGDLRSFELM